jgi:hypothetical protein
MSFQHRSHLIVSDAADLGAAPLQSVSPATLPTASRSHLVPAPALGPDLATNVRQLLARIEALEAGQQTLIDELTKLAHRVTDLEQPWWRRLQTWVLLGWERVWKAGQ